MKGKRLLGALASLIGLLVVVFLAANLLVGSGSMATLVEVARSQCIKNGIPAQDMIVTEVSSKSGILGFGGRATVAFSRVGLGPWGQDVPKVLRVEMRRPMNFSEWEVVSVRKEP
jgi:hypothetical protein